MTVVHETDLIAVIRSTVGPHARIRRHYRDNSSSIGMALNAAEKELGRPVALFIVEGGVPTIFSWPGYDPVIIVLSTRYMELLATISERVFGSHLTSEKFVKSVERLTLRVLAELTLLHGDPALACYLFARSAMKDAYRETRVSFTDLETLTESDVYVIIWFALFHEVGHAYFSRKPGRAVTIDPSPDTSKFITGMLPGAMVLAESETAFRQFTGSANDVRQDLLVEELRADGFAAVTLFCAAANAQGQELRVWELANDILSQFDVFNFLNLCSLSSQLACTNTPESMLADNHAVSGEMRHQFLIQKLSNMIATITATHTLHPRQVVFDLRYINILRREFAQRHDDGSERRRLVDSIRSAAEAEQRDPQRRIIGVYAQIADSLRKGASAARIQEEIETFASIARELSIEHPDIELLCSMTRNPAVAHEILKEHELIYSFARAKDRASQFPLVFNIQNRVVTFAFIRPSSLNRFLIHLRKVGDLDYEVEGSALISATQHDVVARIQSLLISAGYPQAEVLFEGSIEFATLFPALSRDVTIRPLDPLQGGASVAIEVAQLAFRQSVYLGHDDKTHEMTADTNCLLADKEKESIAIVRAAYQKVPGAGRPEFTSMATHDLGGLLSERADVADARAAIQRAIDSGRVDEAAMTAVKLGKLLGNHRDINGARAAYQWAIDTGHYAIAPRAAVDLGNLLIDQGDIAGARFAFQLAIDSGHHDAAPEAAVTLGIVLQDHGDIDGVRAAYQWAIESGHPLCTAVAGVNLGTLLSEQGDIAGARSALQAAIDSSDVEIAPIAALALRRLLEKQDD